MRAAYVTLVMLGDHYVPGAVALAKSLLRTGTCHDLVCMVTKDVSESAIQSLSQVYDTIIVVEYLHMKCPSMMTKRQNEIYGNWIEYSFTKWQCLALGQYDKILYLDADHLVLKNIDHLFELKAPAMCFTDENYNYYNKYSYGTVLFNTTLRMFLKYNKILCKGGTILFEPSAHLYYCILNIVNDNNLTSCCYHNGFDEQVLMRAIVKCNMTITQLSPLYVWNAGSYHKLHKRQEPFVINYYGDVKPWYFNNERINYLYMDIYIWKYIYEK